MNIMIHSLAWNTSSHPASHSLPTDTNARLPMSGNRCASVASGCKPAISKLHTCDNHIVASLGSKMSMGAVTVCTFVIVSLSMATLLVGSVRCCRYQMLRE
jgi:hypothetical protein